MSFNRIQGTMGDATRSAQARAAYEKFAWLWATGTGAFRYLGGNVNRRYLVNIPEGVEITDEEILWVLDRGNGSFGGIREWDMFVVYTD